MEKRLLQSIPVITGLFVVANGHADPITTIDSKLIVQQTSTITGKVLDSNGEALIGVNVLEKEQPMVPSLILMEILL